MCACLGSWPPNLFCLKPAKPSFWLHVKPLLSEIVMTLPTAMSQLNSHPQSVVSDTSQTGSLGKEKGGSLDPKPCAYDLKSPLVPLALSSRASAQQTKAPSADSRRASSRKVILLAERQSTVQFWEALSPSSALGANTVGTVNAYAGKFRSCRKEGSASVIACHKLTCKPRRMQSWPPSPPACPST